MIFNRQFGVGSSQKKSRAPEHQSTRAPVTAYCLLLTVHCLLLTVDADAFSLGTIEVKSSFNESFKAEIPVNVDGQSGLEVSIGNGNDYARLGIERSNIVDSLILDVEFADKDRAIVKLSSTKPINQPSFNLVIKAMLNGGTILENYFLAIDFQKSLSLNLPATDDRLRAEEKQPEEGHPSVEEEIPQKPAAKLAEEEKIESQPSAEAKGLESELPPSQGQIQIPGYIFTRNLKRGDRREDVKNLQEFLKLDPSIYPEGLVTGYFGSWTRASVIRFQEKYASEILSPLGLKSGTGYVGPFTRAKLNTLSESISKSKNIPETSKVSSVPESPLHIESLTSSDTIRQKIMEWKRDWESEDLEKYMSHYSKGFNRSGYNLPSWKEYKKRFNQRHNGIEISIENLQIRREKNLIIVSFRQKFKSDRLESIGRKTIYYEKEGDDWKIKNEKWNRDIPSIRHPYVIHISSFRENGVAEKEVNYFRKNGYSAYEVYVKLPNKSAWHRVIIDRFSSKEEAREFVKTIIKDGHADYAKELELPYAVETGIFESHEDTVKELLKLREMGYSPYPLMVCSSDKCSYQILIGAYANSSNANPISEELNSKSIQNKIVQP